MASAVSPDPPPGIPVWAYMIIALVPSVLVLLGGVRWYVNRAEKRLMASQSNKADAEAERTEAETDNLKEELRLSVLRSVQADMARQREETARAQAAEKEALAELAILIAQHQRDRAEWREHKHGFENEIATRENQITLLRAEVDGLREEVHTLRVALEMEEGRRKDDPPRRGRGQ